MMSPTEASAAAAPALDLPPPDLMSDADQTAEAAASQQINARRALEENIEILRLGRAL
jgi:hypothetical protein